MREKILILLCLPLAACQIVHPTDTTADLDGVWQGVLSVDGRHQALAAHVLDGLMLGMDLDGQQTHSAELVLDGGELAGLFARRDAAGERAEDYTILGKAQAYDRIEADLLGDDADGALSLFYDGEQSLERLRLRDLAGLYSYESADLQLTMSINRQGSIEAYDDAGCAYFGQLDWPDPARNVFAISLSVDGCALAGEYGYGLGSLAYGRDGQVWLNLPLWLDEQDRVEAWRLRRV